MTTSSSDQSSAPVSRLTAVKPARPAPVTGDLARTVFGQVMGLGALTLGFLALGAYIGRPLAGGIGILAAVYAGTGRLNIVLVSLFGFCGAVVGDNIGF